MVWEIWPVFGDDSGYECAFITSPATSMSTLPAHHLHPRDMVHLSNGSDLTLLRCSFNYSQSGSASILSMLQYQAARVCRLWLSVTGTCMLSPKPPH